MRIAIAFDNSPSAVKALKFALTLQTLCTEYVIIHVNPTLVRALTGADGIFSETVVSDQEQYGEKVKSFAEEILKPAGVKYTYVIIEGTGDDVASKIIPKCEELKVDHIITGSRKLSGISKFILGSVSSELIKLSKVPVTVVPPD
ncbi:MAG: universal stress protein [Candidatus Thermoplasmatota archaeon]|jgi:nucleotide-binding universal stress UspA family protein|nr:universal stress protein [Candidatus Thermoplasmatota archaeon]MCL5987784.1 universal stress protein [Candidatus Thermoplasmatota archaeon]